jgi:hypothetical protein
MVHGADGLMSGDCPLSVVIGESLCPLNPVDTAVHHISAYKAFFNILLNNGVLALIISFVGFFYIFFTFVIRSQTVANILRRTYLYRFFPESSPYNSIANSWLSLLEHSPSI